MENIFPTVQREFYFLSGPILLMSIASILAMLQNVFDAVSSRRAVSFTIYASLISSIVLTCISMGYDAGTYLGSGFVSDHLTRMGSLIVLSIGLVITLLCEGSFQSNRIFKGEVASVFLASVTGMLIMITAGEMITMFVGLEIASIAIYALVGYMHPTRKSQEGAAKYLVLGSFASGFLLFGIALVYAGSGTLALDGIASGIKTSGMVGWTRLGVMLVMAGLGFKLALVPFHMWAPDVYEAAPTSLTAFMATGVKAMIIIFTIRLLSNGLVPAGKIWTSVLGFMAAASLIGGNIMGLVQSSLKRMLAYSSIAHSGYMAIAACAIVGQGYALPAQALVYYVVTYSIISLGTFAVIMWLESEEIDNLQIDDIAGLSKRHPVASMALVVFMFSLAGLPPTVGFMSKFFIFNAAIAANLTGLVIIGVIGSTISLYYYLRVIVKMYMTEPIPTAPKLGGGRGGIFAFVAAACIVIVLLTGTIVAGASFDMFAIGANHPIASRPNSAVNVVSDTH